VNEITLKLEDRTAEGKKIAKLRESGYIPSIVYGGKSKPFMTQSPIMATTKVVKLAGRHTPVKLELHGKKKLAIIKDIDIDPVKHTYRHVAFHTINQNDVITTEVPIILIGKGESVAEKAGLVVLQAIEHIEIKAKPADLPESLELSIAELATDEDKLTVADLKLPEGVEFADVDQDTELVIANVYEPSALQAENEAAGGEADADTEVPVEGKETSSEANAANEKTESQE